MSQNAALSRRDTRPCQSVRATLRANTAHPKLEDLYDFAQNAIRRPNGTALTRHLDRCDKCTQTVAEMVWYNLWEKLSA